MNWSRLAVAALLGGAIQIVFLLFGMHASLWFSTMTGDQQRIYWVLNGVYLVAGMAAGLSVIRWAPMRVRLLVGVAVLLLGVVIGLISPVVGA